MATKTINDIIKINSQGLETASYRDIVLILLDRYRQIYGYDIDLDPRTGDGRFIYDVATIINTGVMVIQQMYNNLNPSTASGHFLDIISSFTNVVREGATSSYAKVKLTSLNTDKNKNKISFTIPENSDSENYMLLDDEGNEWTWENFTSPFTISTEGIYAVFKASTPGRINTTGFKWELLTSNTSKIQVDLETISLGSDEESDADLRVRRAETSNNGLTIIESLKGNLEGIPGVNDAIIVSYAGNNDETSKVSFNGEEYDMDFHNVIIMLAYDPVNEPSKVKIAESLKNYLTPGVQTKLSSYKGDYEVKYQEYNENIGTISNIYWYKCNPVAPNIEISLRIRDAIYAGDSTNKLIKEALLDYLNNLGINEIPVLADMINVVQAADPLYQSGPTYYVTNVTIMGTEESTSTYPNKGTYFLYSLSKSEISLNNGVLTITGVLNNG